MIIIDWICVFTFLKIKLALLTLIVYLYFKHIKSQGHTISRHHQHWSPLQRVQHRPVAQIGEIGHRVHLIGEQIIHFHFEHNFVVLGRDIAFSLDCGIFYFVLL